MSGYVKRRAKCPVCEDEFVVTKAGVMRWHLGQIVVNGWRQMCKGVGEAPSGISVEETDR